MGLICGRFIISLFN